MSEHIDPTREQFDAFKDLPRDTPILMLNLIRYRDVADYGDGSDDVSGAEAYRRYGKESGPIFARVGGSIVWRGRPEIVLTGPTDEVWDAAFIACYPHAGAFFEMVTDADYREAVKHRTAAVATSRLIRMAEIDGDSATFA
ncbi:MAG: DUF1330 domain-containing protein [Pseudomonadota bacterium]